MIGFGPPFPDSTMSPTSFVRALAPLMLLGAIALPLQAQRPIKVFISVDMEGIGGVVTAEQLSPAGFEYARFREFMTAEARRHYGATGTSIPSRGAEEFIRGSADAGLLRIVR